MGLVCAGCCTYVIPDNLLQVNYYFYFIDEGNSCSKRNSNSPNSIYLFCGRKDRIEISLIPKSMFCVIQKNCLSVFYIFLISFFFCSMFICMSPLLYYRFFKDKNIISVIIPASSSTSSCLAVSPYS